MRWIIVIFLNKIKPKFTRMVRAKYNIIVSVLLLTFVLSLSGCAADVSKAPVKNVDAFFVVDDVEKARADIEAAGGRVVHIFPEDKVMIGEVAKKFKSKHVDGVYYEGTRQKPKRGKMFFNAWTKSLDYSKLSVAEKMAMIDPDVPENPGDDVVFQGAPDEFKLKTFVKSFPEGAGALDTSFYMVGDVSVGIVTPESISGSEDWTPQELAEVYSEIIDGLSWWVSNNPNAHLTFVYDYKESIPTTYEPIENPRGYSWVYWIPEVMLNLGYGAGTPLDKTGIYDYINDMRHESMHNTDWGFIIFVVDSSSDLDGAFSDGKGAVTVMVDGNGGLYSIMTYDNAGYQITNMDVVTAHETGHIFGAIDQYSPCVCTSTAGYLNYENQNCEDSCGVHESSIMDSSIISAFTSNALDDYARGQIGGADEDSNNILDVLEGGSTLDLFEYSQDPILVDSVSYFGESTINIVSAINPDYNNVSIDRVDNIKYMFNYEGGSSDWVDTNLGYPFFSGYDLVTDYDFTASLPEWGTYLVTAEATNRFGEVYSDNDTVMYVGCEGGNLDPKQKGNVTNYNGTYNQVFDYCTGYMPGNRYVVQYYCDGYNINSTQTRCLYGCQDGRCLNKVIPWPRVYPMVAIDCSDRDVDCDSRGLIRG